ncbi:hypothetical protein KC19_3G242800 [Ceratodon purpureus]|uniref:Uncharacterized protein n=1 Tax=Ceratodon purpureus TaxID=3225 RepID=A0A8T0IPE3_CERPU|nr:hypothetical protein KC19_3G242800 [Ceratodon purpureus]
MKFTLVFMVFLPSLIFTRLSEAITSQKLIDWWYMPLNVFLSFAIGASIGLIVVKYTRPTCNLENLTIACCAAGNTGNVPLVLIPGICEEDDNPFGENLSCSLNGVAYVSFGMWMATLLVWTFIYNLMIPIKINIREGSTEECKLNNIENLNKSNDIKATNEPSHGQISNYNNNNLSNDATSTTLPQIDDSSNEKNHLLQVPNQYVSLFNSIETAPFVATFQNLWMNASNKFSLRQVFTPPTTAAVVALIIGCCSPLKSTIIGHHAPLRFLTECLDILGEATIPCMNLILGGNLIEGISGKGMKVQTTIGVLLTRFLFLPIIGFGLVNSVDSLKLIPNDPLFQFVLLLQFCMPTAINVGTIAQLHGNGEIETSMILFWSYTSSIVLLTVWIMFFLSRV